MDTIKNSIDTNPFWDFTLGFYGKSGVSDACISLQDNFNVDVNILLYCCWMAAEGGGELASEELMEIISVVDPWQKGVVGRLREIRRDMKEPGPMNFGDLSAPLREAIKTCELEGEKISQAILFQSGENPNSDTNRSTIEKVQMAEINVMCYLQLIAGDQTSEMKSDIEKLTQAIAL